MEKLELKTVYYGECCHIFSDDITSSDCIRRYYDIADPLDNINLRLIVCNEHLRLMVREYKFKNPDLNNYYCYEHTVCNIIESVIKSKYRIEYGLDIWHNYAGTDTCIDPLVSYPVCKRPYILKYNKLSELITYMTEIAGNNGWYNFDVIFDSINSTLINLGRHYQRYAKYKKYHNDIFKIIGKLNNQARCSDYRDKFTIENYIALMVIFFEIQSKFKS